MKIYNWIDSLFDSYEKRSSILVILCMMYIAWQTIWQAVFMWDALHIIDVESLFSFYANLDIYEPSRLISIALEIIGQNGFTFTSIYHSISFFDFLMFGLGILGFMKSEHKSNWMVLVLLHLCMFGFIGICIYLGMHASNLDKVLTWLHRMAYGSLMFDALILFFVVYQLVVYCFRLFGCLQNVNNCSS